MTPGDEVEVYHVSAREPWRGEFVCRSADAHGDPVVVVSLRGNGLVLDAGGAVGDHGYYLAPKHVARLKEMRRSGDGS